MYLLIYAISVIICVIYFSYEANRETDNQFKKLIYMLIALPVIVLPIVNTVTAMFVGVDYFFIRNDYYFTRIEEEKEDV